MRFCVSSVRGGTRWIAEKACPRAVACLCDDLDELLTCFRYKTTGRQIRRTVVLNANQTPEYSDIRLAGHEGGDFLFVRKNWGRSP
ncbi:MAG: hypothetical protein WD767_02440 [Alphaproteobacteria bacterium]